MAAVCCHFAPELAVEGGTAAGDGSQVRRAGWLKQSQGRCLGSRDSTVPRAGTVRGRLRPRCVPSADLSFLPLISFLRRTLPRPPAPHLSLVPLVLAGLGGLPLSSDHHLGTLFPFKPGSTAPRYDMVFSGTASLTPKSAHP